MPSNVDLGCNSLGGMIGALLGARATRLITDDSGKRVVAVEVLHQGEKKLITASRDIEAKGLAVVQQALETICQVLTAHIDASPNAPVDASPAAPPHHGDRVSA